MNEISFRQLDMKNKIDVCMFKELHNILFKTTNVSLEWISWYMELTKSSRVYGAFSGNFLVGIWCVEPKTILEYEKSNLETKKVGRCYSVGVHPSFQRRGIFVNLSKFAIQKEKNIGEYSHILGFPQVGRTVIEGHLKAGWDEIQEIDIMSFVPNVVDDLASLSAINRNPEFSSSSSFGNFLCDKEYKQKRWLQHPDHSYICLGYGAGYIVLKPYGNSCHVLDIEGTNEDVTILLETAKTLSKRHGWKELNMWCATNSRIRSSVKSCGFSVGSERGKSIKLLAVRITSDRPLVLNECNFQMGVEEPY